MWHCRRGAALYAPGVVRQRPVNAVNAESAPAPLQWAVFVGTKIKIKIKIRIRIRIKIKTQNNNKTKIKIKIRIKIRIKIQDQEQSRVDPALAALSGCVPRPHPCSLPLLHASALLPLITGCCAAACRSLG